MRAILGPVSSASPAAGDDGYLQDDADDRARLVRHLVLLGLLAASAGWVDAAVFTAVTPTFVANQSGNVVLLGIAVGEGEWRHAAAAATSLAAFAAGLATAAAVRARRVAQGHEPRPLLVVAVEVAALAGLFALVAVDPEPARQVDLRVLAVLAVGAAAMGAQTTLLRRVWGVSVSTTYASGEVVQLSEAEAEAAVSVGDAQRRHHLTVVLATGVTSYATGAAGAAFLAGGARPLLVPPALLAAAAAVIVLDARQGALSRRRRT